MEKTSIIKQIGEKIASEILKERDRVIEADEALISSGLVDSFSLVDLALIVEDLYGVHIDDAELSADTFDTLDQLAELVLQRL
ncbi:MAG TPA: phosphopantetheine-binding protein [Anaerolineaceae bacterium]|nr:phosphopantetheine-binding protein [Anaerolineaceae bacterium]